MGEKAKMAEAEGGGLTIFRNDVTANSVCG